MLYSHNGSIEIAASIKARIVTIALVIAFTLAVTFPKESYASNGSFYQGNNKYKGFYWFETPELQNIKIQIARVMKKRNHSNTQLEKKQAGQ